MSDIDLFYSSVTVWVSKPSLQGGEDDDWKSRGVLAGIEEGALLR